MTKNEFVEYIGFLDKLFNLNNAKDKEIMSAWYKSFENTYLTIAKEMARMYLQEEQGRFRLAKLLEYKSKAMAQKIYCEGDKGKESCPLCNDTGFIQIEVPYLSSYTTKCARCLCSTGRSLPEYIRLVTTKELEEGNLRNGVLRRYDLHPEYADIRDDFKEKAMKYIKGIC